MGPPEAILPAAAVAPVASSPCRERQRLRQKFAPILVELRAKPLLPRSLLAPLAPQPLRTPLLGLDLHEILHLPILRAAEGGGDRRAQMQVRDDQSTASNTYYGGPDRRHLERRGWVHEAHAEAQDAGPAVGRAATLSETGCIFGPLYRGAGR